MRGVRRTSAAPSRGVCAIVRWADAAAAVEACLATKLRAIAIPRLNLGRFRWNQDYADVAMALILMGLALSTAVRDRYRLDAVGVSLLILQTLPIAWRRRKPMRILVITGSAITLYSLLGYLGAKGLGDSNGAYGVVVAFYTVAAHEPRRRATVAAAVTAGGVLVS